VKRGFARRMSVRMAIPFDGVDAVQAALAGLRATPAIWEADPDYDWLNFEGFYKDFELDLAVPPLSYCTLTVEGLAEVEAGADDGSDPATDGEASTLIALQPVEIGDAQMVSSNVTEADYPAWSAGVTYVVGARVIKVATHRIYESAADDNLGNDPAASPLWFDIGPTNRWAMFDQALGTATSRASSIVVVLAPGTVDAVALIDVVASNVRVQAPGYDVTHGASSGSVNFFDLPGTGGDITVTITGSGTVSVGTLLIGTLAGLGLTGESATAGITDFSRKEVDDFGGATVVQRAWAKRMSARSLIRTEKIDIVANRVASLRATPALWIGDDGTQSLQIYGFFKDFSIEVGEIVSVLSLSIEGLSTAAPLAPVPELPVAPVAGVWAIAGTSAADGLPYISVDGIISDSSIMDVIVRYRVTAGGWLASVVIANDQSAISYLLGPLDGLTEYEVQLSYRNAVGQGPWLSLGLVTTLASGVLEAIGGISTARYPLPPPTDWPVGSLYFDQNNIQHRFEGLALTFGDDPLTFGGDPLLGSGYVLVRDKGIGEVIAALQSIDDDGLLTIDEKIRIAIPENSRLEAAYQGIAATATALGLSITALTAARAAWIALRDGLIPDWDDTTQNSLIIRVDWDQVLDDYRQEIENARVLVAAPASVTVVPPEAQLILRDADEVPLTGQFPRTLTPVIKRGTVDIRLDNDVSYSISNTGITATVENTNGDPDKGEIEVTAGGVGNIALTVTVAGVVFGPYAIAFTVRDELPGGTISVESESGTSIAYKFTIGGVDHYRQVGSGTGLAANSSSSVTFPVPFTTKAFFRCTGGSSDVSKEGDIHNTGNSLTTGNFTNSANAAGDYCWEADGY
jgi:hypothetical protein